MRRVHHARPSVLNGWTFAGRGAQKSRMSQGCERQRADSLRHPTQERAPGLLLKRELVIFGTEVHVQERVMVSCRFKITRATFVHAASSAESTSFTAGESPTFDKAAAPCGSLW